MSNFNLTFGDEKSAEENNRPVLELASLQAVEAAEKKEPHSTLSIQSLPPEEQRQVREFVKKIDLSNTAAISAFGAEAQQKVARSSDTMLQNVKTKDLGVIGDSLSTLVSEIKSFDADSSEKKGFSLFGFREKASKSIEKMVAGYSKVETNVDKIVSNLEGHKRQLYKDIAMLDIMYNDNFTYFKEVSMYIIAGNEKLREYNENDIPKQRQKAESTRDEHEIQKLNDMMAFAERFDKRLHDLKLTRTVSLQTAPQIRLIQNNNAVLADKIQSSIVNAIPLWKNQMVIALGLANSRAALKAQTQVTDMTNELLLKNSEMLKQGSVEIAREAERGIVSIDTLKKTNENLISTISEVLDIQRQGSEGRRQAEYELAAIENELKNTLMRTSGRQ